MIILSLFILLLCFIFILFRVFNLSEINWKIFYIFAHFIVFFSIFFYFSNDILFMITSGVKDALILKDPQEFTNLLISVAMFFSFLILYLTFPTIFFTFFFNVLTKNHLYFLGFFLFLYYYFVFLAILLLHLDLYTSSWDIFSFWKQTFFDFQPNLQYVFQTYKGEFKDVWTYFLCYLFFIGWAFGLGVPFWKIQGFRFPLHGFFFLCNMYFLGGDFWLTDVVVLGVSFMLFEIFIFSIIFFSQLKKFKI